MSNYLVPITLGLWLVGALIAALGENWQAACASLGAAVSLWQALEYRSQRDSLRVANDKALGILTRP